MEKQNYIEHEIKVKLMDHILEHSQEYQWFVDYVESNFTLDDITSWTEFNSRFWELKDVYSSFIKIFNMNQGFLETKADLIDDLQKLAQFFIGKFNWEQTSQAVITNFGKILAVVIFTTKLENADNNTDNEISFDLYHIKNYFQLKNIDSIIENSELILNFLMSIQIKGLEFFIDNCIDNIGKKEYKSSEKFFDEYKENLFGEKVFNYPIIQKPLTILWQEGELLKMVCQNYQAIEMTNEDWSFEKLMQLKEFFDNHDVSNFVIETVDYIRNNNIPSNSTLLKHLELLNGLTNNEKENQIFQCISIKIIAKLYEDNHIKIIKNEHAFKEFQKYLHGFKEIFQIENLSSLRWPLTKEQKNILKNEYKKIEEIHFWFDLVQYLEKKPGLQALDDEYLCKVANKFREILQTDNQQDTRKDIPSLFYNYMSYLYEVHNKSVNVDKSIVNSEIMITQKVWQNYYFQQEVNKLQTVRHKVEIRTEEIKNYDSEILENPQILAHHCIIPDRKNLIDFLEETSKYVLLQMSARMHITPIFPIQDKGINLERHDVDEMLNEQISKLVKEQDYRLKNKFETKKYLVALHERYREQLSFLISLIGNEETFYESVKKSSPIILIPYDSSISLAHVTQLFPILEMKIRELAKYHWYLVFKLTASDFMSYKDPSSILREIIKDVYDETGSFENIPDMLFIYHFMYNSNSLNIRNECIHGREYLSDNNLRLAFRVTLLAILMLDRRIKRITENKEVE